MLLEMRSVSAGYGRLQVLRDISLGVNAGEIAAVIGANGAGKTTLLRVLSGLLPTSTGDVVFDGRPITDWSPERVVAAGIAHVPERRQLFSSMRVEDNLMLGAYLRLHGPTRRQVAQDLEYVYVMFPRLRERRWQVAGTLSGGEQQMLAIGRGIMARPRLLLLDEPSLGLAPLLVRELFRVIGELQVSGQTIVLVEQNARQALRIAHVAYVMETGRIVLHGPGKELLANPNVQAAYLGQAISSQTPFT